MVLLVIFCKFSLTANLGARLQVVSLAVPAFLEPDHSHYTGQYHWVAQLAPRKYSLLLGWYTGWVSVLAWVAAAAAPAFLGATLTQGLMVLNNDLYTPERWQSTLIYFAVVLSATMVNVSGY